MNPRIQQLFGDYSEWAGDNTVGALLVLADVMAGQEPVPADRPLSVDEAAKLMRLAPGTVYELCAKGSLAHHRVGRAIRITSGDIDAFQAQSAKAARPGRDKYNWLR
jgi:excisionase family DNA binding protein